MSENLKSEDSKSKLIIKIIGIIQLTGGVSGLFLMSNLLIHTEVINGPTLFLLLFGIGLFIYSCYCGRRLLFDRRKNIAIIISIINQSFQLLQFKLLGYGLSYGSGLELLAGIKNNNISFNIAIVKSTFFMSINSDNEFFIQLNIAAVFMIFFLSKAYTGKTKRVIDCNNEERETVSAGLEEGVNG